MKFTYLLINCFSVIVPLLFSFHPKIQFVKKWKYFFIANAVISVIFICWDVYFTRLGVWSFNDRYVTGAQLFRLPIEEILFFICIPFACVFTYHSLTKFFEFGWNPRVEHFFIMVFAAGLLVTGFLNMHKLYTSFTFIGTGFVCLLLKFVCKVSWLGKFFSVYAILLIPFFIVNGLLTGTGPDEPVVIYNDAENLGLRIATIPVEDIVYGLELVLLNLFLFETLQNVKLLSAKRRHHGGIPDDTVGEY